MAEVEKLPKADKILEIPISYEKQGIKKVAMEMLKKGTSIDFIAEVTHLNVEEIKELKEQL